MEEITRKASFNRIDQSDFVAQLKKNNLFRDNDLTFEELEDHGNYVYIGDDFSVEVDLLDELEVTGLLIIGDLEVDNLSIGEIFPDFGVFCVTGDVRCKNFLFRTETVGVSIGGDVHVENIFYADCSNSVLQINGNLDARVSFNAQSLIEVRGTTKLEFSEKNLTVKDLQAIGFTVKGRGEEVDDIIRAHFESKIK